MESLHYLWPINITLKYVNEVIDVANRSHEILNMNALYSACKFIDPLLRIGVGEGVSDIE